jgi:hypothetical protein
MQQAHQESTENCADKAADKAADGSPPRRGNSRHSYFLVVFIYVAHKPSPRL